MTDFDLAMLRLDVDALTEWDVRFLLIVLGEMLQDRHRLPRKTKHDSDFPE